MMENLLVALIVAWAAWRVWLRYGPQWGCLARAKARGGCASSCSGCGSGAGCASGDKPVTFYRKP